MKKILPVLILLTLVLPVVVLAIVEEAPTTCTLVRSFTIDSLSCTGVTASVEDEGLCCVVNTLYKVTDVVFIFLTGVAVIVGLIGAGILLMAAGAPERVASGRNYIIYAIVGLALAVLVRAIPQITIFILGG